MADKTTQNSDNKSEDKKYTNPVKNSKSKKHIILENMFQMFQNILNTPCCVNLAEEPFTCKEISKELDKFVANASASASAKDKNSKEEKE